MSVLTVIVKLCVHTFYLLKMVFALLFGYVFL